MPSLSSSSCSSNLCPHFFFHISFPDSIWFYSAALVSTVVTFRMLSSLLLCVKASFNFFLHNSLLATLSILYNSKQYKYAGQNVRLIRMKKYNSQDRFYMYLEASNNKKSVNIVLVELGSDLLHAYLIWSGPASSNTIIHCTFSVL